MKEHGILLSKPMVMARQALVKTQTRRVITLYNSRIEKFAGWTKKDVWGMLDFEKARVNMDGKLMMPFKAGVTSLRMAIAVEPFVQPGHRIWFKETWQRAGWDKGGTIQQILYVADGTNSDWLETGKKEYDADFSRIHPSMFMPRWAARFVDTVIGVQAERLQEISAADLKAEGVQYDAATGHYFIDGFDFLSDTALAVYAAFIDHLNGEGTWKSNPLVWVFEWQNQPAQ